MSRQYTAGGKRISSMTHARRSWQCPLCDKVVFGNGGKTSHQRMHVREAGLNPEDFPRTLHAFVAAMKILKPKKSR